MWKISLLFLLLPGCAKEIHEARANPVGDPPVVASAR
jgi:hypothetical protein